MFHIGQTSLTDLKRQKLTLIRLIDRVPDLTEAENEDFEGALHLLDCIQDGLEDHGDIWTNRGPRS